VKEEKGFLHREVKQETPMGYYLGSLAPEQCLHSWSDSSMSRPVGSRTTTNMKNYTLNILSSWTTLRFSSFKTLWYSWFYEYVQPRKEKWDYVYKRGKWGNQRNMNDESILLEELDPMWNNLPRQRRWSSTSVSPSVVAMTTPSKISLILKFWSLPWILQLIIP